MEKQVKIMTEDEVRESVKRVMTWDFGNGGEELLEQITQAICDRKSVVIDAVSYLGNGKYVKHNTKGRYKYKMFVPFVDKNGNIYSTDLFKGNINNAKTAIYEIYSFTRQLVIEIVEVLDTDFATAWNRFGYGYTPEKWGQNMIYVLGRSFTPIP